MSNRLYSKRNKHWKKYEKGRNRKKRPKTFKSKEAVEIYVKKHGIKNYELKNIKFSEEKPKYKIVRK